MVPGYFEYGVARESLRMTPRSSSGSTGLAMYTWNPAFKARSRSSGIMIFSAIAAEGWCQTGAGA